MEFPKYQTIFTFTSVSICLFGLIFQSSEILDAYLQGETVVNIVIDRKITTTLPALTICYPYSISFEKISHLNGVYQEKYNAYLGYSKEYSSTNEKIWQKKMRDVYGEVVNDVFDQINNFSLDIDQVFINYSIEFGNDQGDRMIEIGFNMENLNEESINSIESIKIDKTPVGEWNTENVLHTSVL